MSLKVPQTAGNSAGIALVLISLVSCRNTFEIGTVQYYRVSPRIPSHAATLEEAEKYQFEPYVVIWGMLGTVNEKGPKLTPRSIRLNGERYSISNLKKRNNQYRFYYMFEIRDQNPVQGLPVDPMTGNLFATDPSRRKRLPMEIEFYKKADRTVWTGTGKIEQSTVLTMNAMRRIIDSP